MGNRLSYMCLGLECHPRTFSEALTRLYSCRDTQSSLQFCSGGVAYRRHHRLMAQSLPRQNTNQSPVPSGLKLGVRLGAQRKASDGIDRRVRPKSVTP